MTRGAISPRLVTALALLPLAGCVHVHPAELTPARGWIFVSGVPMVEQPTASSCGEAAMSMVLGYWKTPVSVGDVEAACPHAATSDAVRAGDLRDFARARGLQAFVVPGDRKDLEAQLRKNRPLLVGVVKRISPLGKTGFEHYEVVVGYQPVRRRLVVLDPARGMREVRLSSFEKEWDRAGRLALVVFR